MPVQTIPGSWEPPNYQMSMFVKPLCRGILVLMVDYMQQFPPIPWPTTWLETSGVHPFCTKLFLLDPPSYYLDHKTNGTPTMLKQ